MEERRSGSRATRRNVLGAGLAVATAIGGVAYTGKRFLRSGATESPREYPEPVYGDPDREFRLTATIDEIDVGQGETLETWLYDGRYPGPEIRAKEGERVRITVENDLPEETSVHWHGMAMRGANAMDGVPGVTQPPIEPGEEFVYEFDVSPTGTHWYHSHVGLQLDRNLLGPLIVDEAEPTVEYDREHTIVIDEYLAGEPAVTSADGGGMMGGSPGSPSYEGTLVNGTLPGMPETLSVEEGERVRLRVLNAGSATTYRVAVAGHSMTVTHADGPAVEPVEVDGIDIGTGERFDAIVEADDPGTWEIRAVPLDSDTPPGRAHLRYEDAADDDPRDDPSASRILEYDDLTAVSSLEEYRGSPDRTVDLELSPGGRMMGGAGDEWLINGRAYPDAEPIRLREGEHVRLRVTNHSPMRHPMHLHGHHVVVDGALQDTVTVPGHMGQRTLDFVADNPGDWFFHCHNLYHMETGMARVFEYEKPTG